MAKSVKQFISAISGRIVTEEFAKKNPDITVSRIVKVGQVKHRK